MEEEQGTAVWMEVWMPMYRDAHYFTACSKCSGYSLCRACVQGLSPHAPRHHESASGFDRPEKKANRKKNGMSSVLGQDDE